MTYQLMASGHIKRLADGAVIPPDPMNRDYSEYLEWASYGNQPLPADPIPVFVPPILKTELYARMTDEELEAADAWINTQATVRQRRMFNDAVELSREDPNIIGALTILFGPERAAQLLA